MRYLYICPDCKKAYSAESAEPDDSRICPTCTSNLIYAGCDKTTWDMKSEKAKQEYKEMVLRVFAPGSVAGSGETAAAATYRAPSTPSEPTGQSAQTSYDDAVIATALQARLFNMERDLHTMKNILVFFTVLWAIGIAIIIIGGIAAAAAGASLLDIFM